MTDDIPLIPPLARLSGLRHAPALRPLARTCRRRANRTTRARRSRCRRSTSISWGATKPARSTKYTRPGGLPQGRRGAFRCVVARQHRRSRRTRRVDRAAARRKLAEISPIEHAAMWIGAYGFRHCADVPGAWSSTNASSWRRVRRNGWPQVRQRRAQLAWRHSCTRPRSRSGPCQRQSPRMRITRRAEQIEPFYVMEVLESGVRPRP